MFLWCEIITYSQECKIFYGHKKLNKTILLTESYTITKEMRRKSGLNKPNTNGHNRTSGIQILISCPIRS